VRSLQRLLNLKPFKMACCNDFISYGCYSLCDTAIINPEVVAEVSGTYTIKQSGSGYLKTQTTQGVEDEPLEWVNRFPVGVSHFKLLAPDGSLLGCFYIEILRPIEECPELLTPTKTVSPC
jgi:hypothetical protein